MDDQHRRREACGEARRVVMINRRHIVPWHAAKSGSVALGDVARIPRERVEHTGVAYQTTEPVAVTGDPRNQITAEGVAHRGEPSWIRKPGCDQHIGGAHDVLERAVAPSALDAARKLIAPGSGTLVVHENDDIANRCEKLPIPT